MTDIGKSLTNVPWQMLQGQRTLLLMDVILMLHFKKTCVVDQNSYSYDMMQKAYRFGEYCKNGNSTVEK